MPQRVAQSNEPARALCYHRSRPRDAGFSQMPNIKRLVSWLDRAAARGAIHKNTAARRKAQADLLVSGKPS